MGTTKKTTKTTKHTMAQMARLMDGVMSGRRGRVKAPRLLAEHRLTSEQVRDVAKKVALKHIPGKGLGLVARKALPAHTRVGVYGGKVFSAAEHQRLTDSGVTTGKYAVDFFRRTKDGKVRDDYIMDPGVKNVMHPTHANVLAAFINEPAVGQVPNVVWVRNYKDGTMELWTTHAVPAGQELTACYGTDYERGYRTPCTSKPGYLHYVSPGMPHPKPLAGR